MTEQKQISILEEDVFVLTPKGQAELGGAGTSLSAPELEVLILIDGRSTAGETAARTRALSKDAAVAVLGKLAHAGLIEIVKVDEGAPDFVKW